MSPDRMETELFGTEPGGNGSAMPRRIGVLEQAHGGTLFLDEVADMPLQTQGKLVRVLQEQSFQRVGGKQRLEVDDRVMASTNRELVSEMGQGRVRDGLS